jgi:hypothetical protein
VKVKQAGMQVRSVYGDRGFGTSRADQALRAQQIRDKVIPRASNTPLRSNTRALGNAAIALATASRAASRN